MILLQLLVDGLPAMGKMFRFVTQTGIFAEQSRGAPPRTRQGSERANRIANRLRGFAEEQDTSWGKVFRVILWLAFFVVLLRYVDYLLAVRAFLFLLVRLEARESWTKAITLAGGTCAAFYVLFEVILKAHL